MYWLGYPYQATVREPLVSCKDDRVEHGLVEEEVAHPLGDDDVHLGDRELDLLDLGLDDCDLISPTVHLYNLLGLWESSDDWCHDILWTYVFRDVGVVDPVDVLGAGLGAEDRQNTCPAAHVQNYLILKEVLVLEDRVFVGQGSDRSWCQS